MSPERIGPYELEEKLGEGPHGESYRARDTVTPRTVVVKLIRRDLFNAPPEVFQFLDSARRLTEVNHPNLATIYGAELTENAVCLAHEYVEGTSIGALVESEAIPYTRVLDFAIQIARGIKELHTHGLIHGHISTDNVMVDAKGNIKLLDFGLPALGPGYLHETPPATERVSVFVAEENAPPAEADGDFFALGGLFYEMLTGRPPYDDSGSQTTTGLSVMPPEVRLLVEKLLSSERDEQFIDANELLVTLVEMKRFAELRPEQIDEKMPSTRPYVIISAIAFALIILWWYVTTYHK
ncbi:MAG: serine/threonine-protein kinase [Candidatus Zixiibacteriota bacterium]